MSFHTDKTRICIICEKEYIPRSPKQEACFNPECKREMNRRTSQAYYNKNKDLILADQEVRRQRNISQKPPATAKRNGGQEWEIECKCPARCAKTSIR